MRLVDRFMDFWTTSEYEDYKYDLSIFEMLCYIPIGAVLIAVSAVAVVGTLPIWIIPYLVYKEIIIRKDRSHER